MASRLSLRQSSKLWSSLTASPQARSSLPAWSSRFASNQAAQPQPVASAVATFQQPGAAGRVASSFNLPPQRAKSSSVASASAALGAEPTEATGQPSSGAHARELLPLLSNRDERLVVCDESDFDRLVDACTASFAGDANTGGEGKFRWLFGPENATMRDGEHDPRFIAGLRWYMTFCVRAALKYGSVIGCKDPKTGELMGATLAFHPDSLVNGDFMPLSRLAEMAWGLGSIPRELYRLDLYGLYPAMRVPVGKSTMESLHSVAPKRHWYIMILACDPMHTGKGVGSSLLKTVIELSKMEPGCVTYLESHEAKKTYYEKYMTRAKTVTMKNPDPNGEGDTNMHAFVSAPRQ